MSETQARILLADYAQSKRLGFSGKGGWVHERIMRVAPMGMMFPESYYVHTPSSMFAFYGCDLHGFVPREGDMLSSFVSEPERGSPKWRLAWAVSIGERMIWDTRPKR